MRQFYKQVKVDKTSLRFYADCPICGKRKYGAKLPLLCRDNLDKFAAGTVGGMRQKFYNRGIATAVQHLALYYNRCPTCGQWVCDDCYDLSGEYDFCSNCVKKSSQQNE